MAEKTGVFIGPGQNSNSRYPSNAVDYVHDFGLSASSCMALFVACLVGAGYCLYSDFAYLSVGIDKLEADSKYGHATLAGIIALILTKGICTFSATVMPSGKFRLVRGIALSAGTGAMLFIAAKIWIMGLQLGEQQKSRALAVDKSAELYAQNIAGQMKNAEALRQNAERQSLSKIGEYRTQGGASAKAATRAGENASKDIAAMKSALETRVTPEEEILTPFWHNVNTGYRAFILTYGGYAMIALSGAFLRMRREKQAFEATHLKDIDLKAAPANDDPAASRKQKASVGVTAALAALLGFTAMHPTDAQARTVPTADRQQTQTVPPAQGVGGESVRSSSAKVGRSSAGKAVRKARAPAGSSVDYAKIERAVLSGLKPSRPKIQERFGGSTDKIMEVLHQMERNGVTVRDGQGWKLRA